MPVKQFVHTLVAFLRAFRYSFAELETDTVDPKRIEYKLNHADLAQSRHPKSVRGPVGGDWDMQKTPFEESAKYVAFRQRFIDGVPWPETEYPRSAERDDSYFEQYDALYNEIRCDGFDNDYPITVFIGRNGEYILNEGYHRLSIAKILDLDEVPVQIKARHESVADR